MSNHSYLICDAEHWTHLPPNHPLRQKGHELHTRRVPEEAEPEEDEPEHEEPGDEDAAAGQAEQEDEGQAEDVAVKRWPPKPVQLPPTAERPALRDDKSLLQAAQDGDRDLVDGKDPTTRPEKGGQHGRCLKMVTCICLLPSSSLKHHIHSDAVLAHCI